MTEIHKNRHIQKPAIHKKYWQKGNSLTSDINIATTISLYEKKNILLIGMKWYECCINKIIINIHILLIEDKNRENVSKIKLLLKDAVLYSVFTLVIEQKFNIELLVIEQNWHFLCQWLLPTATFTSSTSVSFANEFMSIQPLSSIIIHLLWQKAKGPSSSIHKCSILYTSRLKGSLSINQKENMNVCEHVWTNTVHTLDSFGTED